MDVSRRPVVVTVSPLSQVCSELRDAADIVTCLADCVYCPDHSRGVEAPLAFSTVNLLLPKAMLFG